MKHTETSNESSGKVVHVRPEELPPQAKVIEEAPVKPLRVRLRTSDFELHGYTSGCPGCRALLRRAPPVTFRRMSSENGQHARA